MAELADLLLVAAGGAMTLFASFVQHRWSQSAAKTRRAWDVEDANTSHTRRLERERHDRERQQRSAYTEPIQTFIALVSARIAQDSFLATAQEVAQTSGIEGGEGERLAERLEQKFGQHRLKADEFEYAATSALAAALSISVILLPPVWRLYLAMHDKSEGALGVQTAIVAALRDDLSEYIETGSLPSDPTVPAQP